MTFQDLLRGADVLAQCGNPPVTGIQYDSRHISPGDVFIAMRGESNDGNCFIQQAITAGAVAVVTDSDVQPQTVAWARIPHGRQALAILSANFFGQPAQKLAITGITGTNGKSTTAFLLESILIAAARRTALVGTIEYHIAGKILSAPHTTPEPLDLHRLFREAVDNQVSEVAMEVSSHALAQQRTYATPFDVVVFTNLTRDHLDYHGSMEQYFAAKRLLFAGNAGNVPRVSVINLEDEYGRDLLKFALSRSRVLTYGISSGDFHARNLDISARGTQFDMATPVGDIRIFSPLIGRVNAYNILAAAAAAYARRCNAQAIAAGVANLARVPGRFEPVECGQPFTVVVDYAHTDDALRNLVSLARQFVRPEGGRVITVFGCGGDRDRKKRPLMGEAAGEGSDYVVLTSDNPRTEDPMTVMNDALVGLQRRRARYKLEPDRRAAIHLALKEAQDRDIVLIAGKGHEKVQVTATGSIPFDDRQVAAEALRELGYKTAAPGAPS
jgi:UDP-N-acetylmuramoyl-L-alanyl-D-glutamate--2,6-diaminopimelate ligase